MKKIIINSKGVYELNDEMVEYLNKLDSVSLFPSELKPPTLNDKVSIVERVSTGGRCAIANQDIQVGEIICINDSAKIDRPIKYSWQLDANTHLIGPGALDHNCQHPTCGIDINNNFIALKNIKKEELLTFNYLTTEYNMNMAFECICGEEECFKIIKGFKYLTESEKLKVKKFGVSNYINSMK